MSVADPNEFYHATVDEWALISALNGGTRAMRAAGQKYLPQHPREPSEAYRIRLQRSVLTNFYKKAVNKLSGKPYRRPVTLSEKLPEDIRGLRNNITNTGVNLDVFCRRMLRIAIDDGLCHVLIDMPVVPEGGATLPNNVLSLADVRNLKLRPYASLIPGSSVIGWKTAIKDGEQVLTEIRYVCYEDREDPDDPWNPKSVMQIRVINEVEFTAYEEVEVSPGESGEKRTEWQKIATLTQPNRLGRVPIVTLYTNKHGFMKASPMLIDLANLNVAHWQSDSDQRNIVHVARVPLLFSSGLGDEDDGDRVQLDVGISSFIRAPKGADMKFVEHSGDAITSGERDIAALEQRMHTMSMEPVMRGAARGPAQTATQRTMDQVEEDTELGAVAREQERVLEAMFAVMQEWNGEADSDFTGTVEIFKDFGISRDDSENIAHLISLRAQNDLSRTGLIRELKRRNVLHEDFDPEEDADLLELEPPDESAVGAFGAFGSQGGPVP